MSTQIHWGIENIVQTSNAYWCWRSLYIINKDNPSTACKGHDNWTRITKTKGEFFASFLKIKIFSSFPNCFYKYVPIGNLKTQRLVLILMSRENKKISWIHILKRWRMNSSAHRNIIYHIKIKNCLFFLKKFII